MSVATNRKKRLLALALCLCMALSLAPFSARAVDVDTLEDISKSAWYYEDVAFVTRNDYMIGVSARGFGPELTLSRAMMATILARYAEAEVDDSISAFSDVPVNQWYTGAVTWANEAEICLGYADGTFAPDAPITRQELAALFSRFIKWYEENKEAVHAKDGSTALFPDNDKIADWAKKDVAQCRAYGLFNGIDAEGNFAPEANSTRAQVAALMHRLNWVVGGPIDKRDYTVTLMSEGKVYASATVRGGDKYTMPANPTRSGYAFAGWSLTEKGKADSQYKAGAEILIASDLTLYAVWNASGGGFGGDPSDKPTEHTLTLNANGGHFVGDSTVTEATRPAYSPDFTYTLTPDDAPDSRIDDGYEFLGYADKKDAVEPDYVIGDDSKNTVEIPEAGKEIFAVWQYDYIAKAVQNTVEWSEQVKDKNGAKSNGPVTAVNRGIEAFIDFINAQWNKKPGLYGEYGKIPTNAARMWVDYDAEKAEDGKRHVDVHIDMASTSPQVLGIAEFAVRYLGELIGGTKNMTDLKEDLKTLIEGVVTSMGYKLDDSKEFTEGLNTLVKQLAEEYSQDFKEQWTILDPGNVQKPLDVGQGSPVITHMTATATAKNYKKATAREIANVEVGSVNTEDVTNAALALLVTLKDDAKRYSEYTSILDLTAVVDVAFTPAKEISQYYEPGGHLKKDYVVNVILQADNQNTAEDQTRNYVQYRFSETDGSFIKVIVPEKVKTAYNDKVGDKLDELLQSETVVDAIDSKINEEVDPLVSELKEQANRLGQSFGGNLSNIGDQVEDAISKWLKVNKLNGTDIKESYVYRRMAGEENAMPESFSSFDVVLSAVYMAMKNKLDGEIEKVPGSELEYTLGSYQLNLKLPEDLNAQKQIKDAIQKATPGTLGATLETTLNDITAQFENWVTTEQTEVQGIIETAIDQAQPAIQDLQKNILKNMIKGDGYTTVQAGIIAQIELKVAEASGTIQMLQQYEGGTTSRPELSEPVKAVVAYLEALLIESDSSVETLEKQTKAELDAALADFVYDQVSVYEPLMKTFEALKDFDQVWGMNLKEITDLVGEEHEEIRKTVFGALTAEHWQSAVDFVDNAATALTDGKIDGTPIPLFENLKGVSLQIGKDREKINIEGLASDLSSLKSKMETAMETNPAAAAAAAGVEDPYDAACLDVVKEVNTILTKYGLYQLSLSDFEEDSANGVLVTGTYDSYELSFYLVLEKGWLPAPTE